VEALAISVVRLSWSRESMESAHVFYLPAFMRLFGYSIS
jgi:hypothetical protein